MSKRFYGPDRDPVGRHVGEDVLGRALRELCNDAERRLLLRYLHGETPQQLARDVGLGPGIFSMLIAGLLDRLRTSRYAAALRQELSGPRFSAEVWGGAAEVPAHRCERSACDAPPFPQRPMGRPRRFCSSACRQAAYRERLRTGAGRRLAAGSQLGGPRPARLTDYSAALPAFPSPRALPDWESFRDYLDKAIRRWHEPTAAEDGLPATPVLWPAGFSPHSRSTAVPDGQSRQISLVGGKTVEIGRLIASSLWRRAGLLPLGSPATGGTQLHEAHRVFRPCLAFLPPTPTSPVIICVDEVHTSRPPAGYWNRLVTALATERSRAVLFLPHPTAPVARTPKADTVAPTTRQAWSTSRGWPVQCRRQLPVPPKPRRRARHR